MKLLIIGHGQHGKDTLAELLAEKGMSFVSSSWFCAERCVMEYFEGVGIKYPSVEACYEDRDNHRAIWKRAISDYNNPKDRLVTEILEDYDIYVGLRKRDEFEAGMHHFDEIIWVDRSEHLGPEETNELTQEDATLVVDNNGSLDDLKVQASMLFHDLKRMHG
jgi:hypothetical protein